jgi:hypothetical protein
VAERTSGQRVSHTNGVRLVRVLFITGRAARVSASGFGGKAESTSERAVSASLAKRAEPCLGVREAMRARERVGGPGAKPRTNIGGAVRI